MATINYSQLLFNTWKLLPGTYINVIIIIHVAYIRTVIWKMFFVKIFSNRSDHLKFRPMVIIII